MNAIQLVQSAARRLNIMIPKTIEQSTLDTVAIDYDANLLLECLNSSINQFSQTSLFKKYEFYFSRVLFEGDDWFEISQHNSIKIFLDILFTNFISIIGEGVHFYIIDLEDTKAIKRDVLFRQLHANQFERLDNYDAEKTDAPCPPEYRDNPSKNSPSKEESDAHYGTKQESGFYIYFDPDKNSRILHIKQNLLTYDEIMDTDPARPTKSALNFFYQGSPLHVTKDKDVINLNDELLILSTVVNYKSTNGLDFTLELGQQKALLDALKTNQENIQVTSLNQHKY
jgi:hypothetical protein